MPIPTITVEVAFASTPLATSPTWTDVTTYVRNSPGIRISRGRASESSTFSAGQLSLTFDNRDRRFDPLHASGPYFGNLTPRKQIRVRANWQGTDFTLFRGFVAGWPTQHPVKGLDAVTSVVAYDGLAFLNDTPMPDQIERFLSSTVATPVRFYRFGSDAGIVDTIANETISLMAGSLPIAANSMASEAGDKSQALQFDGLTGFRRPDRLFFGDTFFGLTGSISFWLQTTSKGPSLSDWMSVLGDNGPGTGQMTRVGIDSDGKLRYHYRESTLPLSRYVSSAISVADGQPHHIVISDPTSGDTRIYVDGVDRSTAQSGTVGPVHRFDTIGAPMRGTSDTYFTGALQDIALIPAEMTPVQVAFLYLAYAGARPEVASARLVSVLDSVNWPASWRQWSTYLTSVADVWRTNGTSALAQLQALGSTEQGRLFCDRNGDIFLQARHHASTDGIGRTVRVALADNGSAVPFVEFDGFDPGDRDVVNDVTASARYGSARSSDATSITNNGQRGRSVSTLVRSVDEAKSIADGLVYLGKSPRSRAMPVTVSLQDSATWSTTVGSAAVGSALVGGAAVVHSLLGIDVGYRYRLSLTPMGVGAATVQELLVESVDWSITQTDMEIQLSGTPAPANHWAIVGTSTVGSTDVTGF